jgi:hypothetical protein
MDLICSSVERLESFAFCARATKHHDSITATTRRQANFMVPPVQSGTLQAANHRALIGRRKAIRIFVGVTFS